MSELTRRVYLSVSIDGYDVAGAFAPYLLDFTYTDNASGKSDDLQLSLQNSDGRFSGEWRPKKGMEIIASIICENWENQGEDLELPCGAFKIDEVELSGPPDKIQIKAVSASLSGGLRDTQKTRAWEKTSLQTVAGQISSENELELLYSGPDHQFDRQDQRNESDIAFVNRICGDFGMNCKVHNGKLAIFDSEENESGDAAVEIAKTGAMYSPKSYSFKMSSSDTDYDNAEVSYTDPKTGKTQKATASAQKKNTKKDGKEKTLVINQRVENPDQAQKVARSKLQKKNQSEQTASLECMGNPRLVAGSNVTLTGFEEFSGQWCIKTATHKIGGSGGYSTSLELSAPSLTKEGRAESFSWDGAEIVQTPGYDYEQDERNIATKEEIENFDTLAVKVNRTGDDLDKLIMCLPDIALAEAERCWNKDNGKGWFYLSQMLAKWLSIKQGQKNVSPFWVDWDWVLSYKRASGAYWNFLSEKGDPYVFSAKGKDKLREIIGRPGNLVNDSFSFISSQWEKWEADYFNLHKVDPRWPWTDGLVAAMQGFTFRALANGTRNAAGAINVNKLAIFVHDVFNFDEDSPLDGFIGYWSCKNMDFNLIPKDNSYFELKNKKMRDFAEKYQIGANFLVLSDPHIVEDFRGMDYE